MRICDLDFIMEDYMDLYECLPPACKYYEEIFAYYTYRAWAYDELFLYLEERFGYEDANPEAIVASVNNFRRRMHRFKRLVATEYYEIYRIAEETVCEAQACIEDILGI